MATAATTKPTESVETENVAAEAPKPFKTITAKIDLDTYAKLKTLRHRREIDKFSDVLDAAVIEFVDNHADELA